MAPKPHISTFRIGHTERTPGEAVQYLDVKQLLPRPKGAGACLNHIYWVPGSPKFGESDIHNFQGYITTGEPGSYTPVDLEAEFDTNRKGNVMVRIYKTKGPQTLHPEMLKGIQGVARDWYAAKDTIGTPRYSRDRSELRFAMSR